MTLTVCASSIFTGGYYALAGDIVLGVLGAVLATKIRKKKRDPKKS